MRAAHPIATAWKTTVLTGVLVLALGTLGAVSASVSTDRHGWYRKYSWPGRIPFPKDNPYSDAKLKLGRMLFFDPILSGSENLSCASCHNPSLSWADGQPRAIAEKQEPLPLRTPTLLDVAWTPLLGWTGHFRDLESVAMGPITAADNMNLPEPKLIERLTAIPAYIDAFHAAYPGGDITGQTIEMALATFERTIVSTQAPFDHWIDGNPVAISASAKRGFDLFNGKANCAACHSGWAFTDGSFHDIGTAKNDDLGRGKLFPTSVALRYAFKTPTLRDVARRAPYMHDGSVATLQAVIDLYNRGGIDRPSRDPEIHPLGLTTGEEADLIAFLDSLNGEPKTVLMPTLPR
jgi:cytochrome c peroxidase